MVFSDHLALRQGVFPIARVQDGPRIPCFNGMSGICRAETWFSFFQELESFISGIVRHGGVGMG